MPALGKLENSKRTGLTGGLFDRVLCIGGTYRYHQAKRLAGETFRRLNSVACGLPVRFGMHRGEVGACLIAVPGYAALQRIQALVLEFAVQFV